MTIRIGLKKLLVVKLNNETWNLDMVYKNQKDSYLGTIFFVNWTTKRTERVQLY